MLKFYTSLAYLLFLCDGYFQYSYNGSNKHTFQTDFDNIELGPTSSVCAHICTDRSKVFFNKDVYTTSNAFSSFSNDLILKTKEAKPLRISDTYDYVGIGAVHPKSPLSIDSDDVIMGFKNTDGVRLYTSRLYNLETRGLWMILDSSLPSFNISTEDETDKILFNGGEVGTGAHTTDRILTVNGVIM